MPQLSVVVRSAYACLLPAHTWIEYVVLMIMESKEALCALRRSSSQQARPHAQWASNEGGTRGLWTLPTAHTAVRSHSTPPLTSMTSCLGAACFMASLISRSQDLWARRSLGSVHPARGRAGRLHARVRGQGAATCVHAN